MPSWATMECITMQKAVIFDQFGYVITSHGNGVGYDITRVADLAHGAKSVWLQCDVPQGSGQFDSCEGTQ